jgi:hypothetical protein
MLAPPVMVLMMLLVRRKKVMGELQVEGWLYWLGWLATITMALSVVGMAFSLASHLCRRKIADADHPNLALAPLIATAANST